MKAKDLRVILGQVPDDAEIVVPGEDHSYRTVRVSVTTGLYNTKHRVWSEDYGEEMTPEKDNGKRLPIVLFH